MCLLCRILLLPIPAVDPDSDGAVVGEGDFHIGSEDASGDGFSESCGEVLAEGFVERLGNGGCGGSKKRRAVALFCGGIEGELADDEDVSTGVENGAVHFRFYVLEDSHPSDLSAEPFAVGSVISDCYTEQDEKSRADGGDSFSGDGD